MAFHAPQIYMTFHPTLGMGEGNNGFFRFIKDGLCYTVQSSDGLGWNHVSVTVNRKRCPTWEEMCYVKDLFWDETDTVIQYHPSKDQYVNVHPYCLHLWQSQDQVIPTPPTFMI